MDLEEILEDCKMQTELMDLFGGKTFSEPKEIKIKKNSKKEKHLISVSEEFYHPQEHQRHGNKQNPSFATKTLMKPYGDRNRTNYSKIKPPGGKELYKST